ncbi:histidine kinase, dimerization/phosphoacceptor [Caballeronia calidae]|uniref:Histidine kinase, dimerization/phosphoacceptor n=1 Tax=Caballeronia calidae TaxID=1777139 RepID=A0A158EHP8_9BURK|nr:serine/threonine-protein kinase [Caballeronia calidae]SAL06220.1 histidine kinase, dimerization/phosphoacceptor [Caballeronia calidae]
MLKPYNRAELVFDLIAEIGAEGKNSTVYRAHDHQLNAELVVKKIAKKSVGDVNAFFSEASILYETQHDNVVPVYYACEDADSIYIAMPFFPNGSLNALLERRFLTVREIVRYSLQFLSGLHNIHSKKLIHFDIKPDNILLTRRDEAVISDFGLAKRMDGAGLAVQGFTYTKIIPPERLDGAVGHTVLHDIYQVGVTLYRMCAGNAAFYNQWESFCKDGKLQVQPFIDAVKGGRFPQRDELPEHIPQKLRNIVAKCLEADPAQRYASVLSVMNDLAAIDGPELDWHFSHTADGGRKWSRTFDGCECYIEVDASGQSIARKQKRNGQYVAINAYCDDNLSRRKLKSFFKEA